MSKLKKVIDSFEGSDDAIRKFLRGLKGESDDAVATVGSGKNLEALQKVAGDVEADDATRKLIETASPADVGPIGQSVGVDDIEDAASPAYNAVAGRADDAMEYLPPAKPQAIKPEAPNSMKQLEGTMELPSPSIDKKKAATAVGALGAATLPFMGGDDEVIQPPMAPKAKSVAPAAPAQEAKKESPKDTKVSMKSSSSSKTTVSGASPAINTIVQESVKDIAKPEYDEMAEAEKVDMERGLMAGLLRAGQQAGAAIAGVKADTSYADILEKNVGSAVRNVTTRIDTEKKKVELEKAKSEADSEKAMLNPGSAISAYTRQIYGQFGAKVPDNVSAAQLKANGTLGNMIVTKAANELKIQELRDARETRAEQKQNEGFNKHVDTYSKMLQKDYDKLNKATANIEGYEQIINSAANGIEPGPKDITLLYSFIKTMDPDSVVRESEIGLSRQAMSMIGRIKSGAAQLTGGDLLDQNTRESFQEIMKAYARAQQNSFRRAKSNAIKAGVEKGYDPQALNRGLYSEVDALNVPSKAAAPQGGMVLVTRIADGQKKMLPAERAAKLDQTKYKVGQ